MLCKENKCWEIIQRSEDEAIRDWYHHGLARQCSFGTEHGWCVAIYPYGLMKFKFSHL